MSDTPLIKLIDPVRFIMELFDQSIAIDYTLLVIINIEDVGGALTPLG